MEEKVVIHGRLGTIVGSLSRPNNIKSKTLVLLVHGFAATKNNKAVLKWKELFESLGFITVRMDLYNHGESFGKFEDMTITACIKSIEDAIDYFLKEGFESIGLCGSSMGGLVALFGSIKKIEHIKFLILRSPVSMNQGDIIANFHKLDIKFWKSNKSIEWHNKLGAISKLNYKFYEDAQLFDANIIANKITAPTLIVHGDNDNFVPLSGSKTLAVKLKNNTLKVLIGADHLYTDKETEEMMRYMTEFLVSNNLLTK